VALARTPNRSSQQQRTCSHPHTTHHHRITTAQVAAEVAPREPHPDWPKITVEGRRSDTLKMQAACWHGKHKVKRGGWGRVRFQCWGQTGWLELLSTPAWQSNTAAHRSSRPP